MNKLIRKIAKALLFMDAGSRSLRVKKDASSSFVSATPVSLMKGSMLISNNSVVTIGKNVALSGEIHVEDNSELVIGDDCNLSNVDWFIFAKGVFRLGKGCVIDLPEKREITTKIVNGTLELAERVHLKARILVRFGGRMEIGACADIGYGTEIRCEESVRIGEFCLISYDVCIYDTNTHSTDWKKRRELYLRGYPYGADEVEKPATEAVRIGNDVWLGKESTVLKGARIGDRCIVGIRTIVPRGTYEADSRIVSPRPAIIRDEG